MVSYHEETNKKNRKTWLSRTILRVSVFSFHHHQASRSVVVIIMMLMIIFPFCYLLTMSIGVVGFSYHHHLFTPALSKTSSMYKHHQQSEQLCHHHHPHSQSCSPLLSHQQQDDGQNDGNPNIPNTHKVIHPQGKLREEVEKFLMMYTCKICLARNAQMVRTLPVR